MLIASFGTKLRSWKDKYKPCKFVSLLFDNMRVDNWQTHFCVNLRFLNMQSSYVRNLDFLKNSFYSSTVFNYLFTYSMWWCSQCIKSWVSWRILLWCSSWTPSRFWLYSKKWPYGWRAKQVRICSYLILMILKLLSGGAEVQLVTPKLAFLKHFLCQYIGVTVNFFSQLQTILYGPLFEPSCCFETLNWKKNSSWK